MPVLHDTHPGDIDADHARQITLTAINVARAAGTRGLG